MQAPTSLTPDGQSKSEDFNTLCVVQGQKLQGPQWLSIELVFGEKIAKPQGFPRVLPNWWVMQTKSFSSSPAMLPFAPPDVDVANSIFLEFSSHYRTLEQSLQRARLIQATQRRSQDPLMIYKDIQREKAEPVQTIVAKHAIDIHTVVETSDNTTTITLAKLLPAGVHLLSRPRCSEQLPTDWSDQFLHPSGSCHTAGRFSPDQSTSGWHPSHPDGLRIRMGPKMAKAWPHQAR